MEKENCFYWNLSQSNLNKLISSDIHESWRDLIQSFFDCGAGQKLLPFLQKRLSERAVVFPPDPLRVFKLTPLESVRVVILGQDPYHGQGQAEGLAFSVAKGIQIPPSLRNIFKEIQRDLGGLTAEQLKAPINGSLVSWAQSGVLLLNTCLTVEESSPASHAGRGWEVLTDWVIEKVSQESPNVVFMLWGSHAQSKQALIDSKKHLVLTANHPSPLSAQRPPKPFVGCAHFSQASNWLKARGVDWTLWDKKDN